MPGALCPACLLRLAAMPRSRVPAYDVEALLGAGSGTTHLARGSGGAVLAVKTLDARDVAPDVAAALEDLSRRLQEFRHASIAPGHGLEIENGAVRLVRDYVRGRAFGDWIASADPAARDAARAALAGALAAAHAHDLPHGRLIAANIVITGGRPLLLDLGTPLALEILQGRVPDLPALRQDDLARLARLAG